MTQLVHNFCYALQSVLRNWRRMISHHVYLERRLLNSTVLVYFIIDVIMFNCEDLPLPLLNAYFLYAFI